MSKSKKCPCGVTPKIWDRTDPKNPICYDICASTPLCLGCQKPLSYSERKTGVHWSGSCFSCQCGQKLDFWDYLNESKTCFSCTKIPIL